MKPNLVDTMIPAYVKNFSCAAEKCPDHCCHSWNVSVDKKSFKALKKNSHVIIKQLANDHLKLTRTTENEWGLINMKSDGNCPFLDEQSLCEIHKNCGHEALSQTCQSYPRAYFWFGEQVESSLSLSCPSAAQELLFNPSAMMFDVKQQASHKLNNGKFAGYLSNQLPAWMPILRDACFGIILYDQIPLEERLFSLGMLLKQVGQHLDDIERLQQLIQSVEEMITDGSFSAMYQKLPISHEVKWLMFTAQDKKLVNETKMLKNGEQAKLSTSDQRFDDCRQLMIQLFEQRMANVTQESEQVTVFSQILSDAKPYLDNYFKENQHVLVNYFLYYLYHNQFMFNQNKSPFEFFTVMSVDFFVLKSYLSAIALTQEGLTNEWLAKLFQSYARRRQHKHDFVKNMEEQLKANNIQSAGAILGLLKITD